MNLFYFGNMLNYAGLLMVCALGASFALKNGQMNLGGEGQVYAGGFVTAVSLNVINDFFPDFVPVFFPLVISALLVMLVCALSSIFCCVLRLKRNASELLTTFLFSAASIPLIDSAITGPFRVKDGNLIATPFISEKVRFPHILPPSNFNVTFFIALALCLFGFFILYRTVFGKKICIFGISNEFALFSGFSRKQSVIFPLVISSSLHGLAGFLAVTGTYYTCHTGFYSGLGWNGLSCALLSRSNPLIVIFMAIFLSMIYTFADKIALMHNFGFDVSVLLQGGFLLITAFSLVLKGRIKL